MIESLSSTQRRLLALAILAVVLVVIYAATVVPLRALNRHHLETIERLETRLAILQRSVATDASLRARHAQLQKAMAANRQYLKSETDALAAADLQGIVKRIATRNATELLSTQILPATEESGFTRVALKVRMRGLLDNLVKAFHGLETGQPYLFLDNVGIRKLTIRRFQNAAGDQLDVDFELIGYMPRPS